MNRLWTARAHSKVNLHLGVGDAREDGFHELATVFQSLELHDEVSFTPGPETEIVVTGPHAAGVPTTPDNLAWRAIAAVAAALGKPEAATGTLRLTKNIPAAGGMAGGSADAAAALLLANQAISEEIGCAPVAHKILYRIAADLGSDVPFTLMGGTALGRPSG